MKTSVAPCVSITPWQPPRRLGADTFVELSAHPSLLYPLADIVDDETTVIVGSGHRGQAITDSLSANIAAVATADPGCQWANAIPGGVRPPLRRFPNAPMRARAPVGRTANRWTERRRLPALTVAVEDWQQAASPTSATAAGAASRSSPRARGRRLTQRLIDAVVAHGSCQAVPPNEAEIVAVIAPELDELDATAAIEQIAGRPDAGLPDYAAIDRPDDAGPSGCSPPVPNRSIRTSRTSPGAGGAGRDAPQRRLRIPGPDASGTSTCRAEMSMPGPRSPSSTCCSVRRPRSRCAAAQSPRRYVRTFRECRDSATRRPLDAAALDNVVITGGSGAIGLQYARYCVEHGARTVTLLSRNGIDPAALRQLAENHDAEVHAPPCDITDPAALSAVAAEYCRCRRVIADPYRGYRQGPLAVPISPAPMWRRCVPRRCVDWRCWPSLAAAAGLPNPGLLVGVRGMGRLRSRGLRGVQPDARRVGRPVAQQGPRLHGDSMGTVAGRRSRGGPTRSPAPSAPGWSRWTRSWRSRPACTATTAIR